MTRFTLGETNSSQLKDSCLNRKWLEVLQSGAEGLHEGLPGDGVGEWVEDGVDSSEVGPEAVGEGVSEVGLAVIELVAIDAAHPEGPVVVVAEEVDGAREGVEEGTEVHSIDTMLTIDLCSYTFIKIRQSILKRALHVYVTISRP